MKQQRFKIGEYAKEVGSNLFHKIADAELSDRGRWYYTTSTGRTLSQNHLDKWEPKECDMVVSDISLDVGDHFKTYTVVLTIKEVLENKCEFKMSDDSILHITEIRPYTGEF